MKGVLKVGEKWNKTDGVQKPSMEVIKTFVNSPLFERLCDYLETEY
jgi:hypothetical protein